MVGSGRKSGEGRQKGRRIVGRKTPGRSVIYIIFIIGPINPTQNSGVEAGGIGGSLTKFLNVNRIDACCHGYKRIPCCLRRSSLIAVNMGGVHDPISRSCIRKPAITLSATGAPTGNPR